MMKIQCERIKPKARAEIKVHLDGIKLYIKFGWWHWKMIKRYLIIIELSCRVTTLAQISAYMEKLCPQDNSNK